MKFAEILAVLPLVAAAPYYPDPYAQEQYRAPVRPFYNPYALRAGFYNQRPSYYEEEQEEVVSPQDYYYNGYYDEEETAPFFPPQEPAYLLDRTPSPLDFYSMAVPEESKAVETKETKKEAKKSSSDKKKSSSSDKKKKSSEKKESKKSEKEVSVTPVITVGSEIDPKTLEKKLKKHLSSKQIRRVVDVLKEVNKVESTSSSSMKAEEAPAAIPAAKEDKKKSSKKSSSSSSKKVKTEEPSIADVAPVFPQEKKPSAEDVKPTTEEKKSDSIATGMDVTPSKPTTTTPEDDLTLDMPAAEPAAPSVDPALPVEPIADAPLPTTAVLPEEPKPAAATPSPTPKSSAASLSASLAVSLFAIMVSLF